MIIDYETSYELYKKNETLIKARFFLIYFTKCNSSSTLSVTSHGNKISVRPKCP